MSDDTHASDTNPDAEPTISETPTPVVETPALAPETKKVVRGDKSAKPLKAAKPAKATRAAKAGKPEDAVASTPEIARTAKAPKTAAASRARKAAKPEKSAAPAPEVTAVPVTKTANTRSPARTAKTAKPAKPTKPVEAAKVAKPAGTNKRAKPEKAAEAAKPAKVAKSSKKVAKAASATAAKKAAPVATGGNGKGTRYTTNELSGAVRKAGLTVQFNPVVMASVNIGRGPAKEFKVDMIVARLRGSNGGLINERGPGTPLYNDAESLAAVEIFAKFRGRTFHNKLKVEIL